MSRLKRIMKRLAIGFAILVAVGLILNGAYSWHTGHQLAERLAKLRAAGEPITFADLAPKPIPPEQDAAVHLRRLMPRLKSFEKEYLKFYDKTPLGKSFGEREDRGEPPTSEQIAAIREIFSHYPELPQAIDEASRCEGYTSQIDYTVDEVSASSGLPSPVIDELMSTISRRMPTRFLRWKITVLLAEEKPEEALETGLVILRLASHYDGEPALVNGLLALAVRGVAVDSLNLALRTGAISKEVRQQLDQELAHHGDPAWIQHVMKTERVISLCTSRSMFAEAWWLPWMARGLEVDMLDFYQRLLPIFSQPWHRSRDKIRNLNTDDVSYSTPMSGVLLKLLEPALESTVEAFYRNLAMLRCLRIVNGLTAYAQANGHEAEGLDDLDLPEAAKIDPFSGKPLRLKWTDRGWVVYTVFRNGTDDGGDFKNQSDWGLGPVGYPYPD